MKTVLGLMESLTVTLLSVFPAKSSKIFLRCLHEGLRRAEVRSRYTKIINPYLILRSQQVFWGPISFSFDVQPSDNVFSLECLEKGASVL